MTPAPVCLPIIFVELGKSDIFTMVLFCVHMIRPIFVVIPFMIVIMLVVVIDNGPVILGEQRGWRHCDGGDKGGSEESRIPETGRDYSHTWQQGTCRARHFPAAAANATNRLQRRLVPAERSSSRLREGLARVR
jgi:hypothetical protein